MNKTSQKSALLLAALVAAGLPALAAEPTNGTGTNKVLAKPMALFADETVAQGKGVKVSRAMLDDELVNIKVSAAARGQTIPPQRMKLLEADVLERLVGRQLLNLRATEADKTAGAENATKALENIEKNAGGDEALARQLKTVGMTLDELKSKLNDESVAEAVLQREIKFEVSDDDVKKFYEENPGRFEQPEQLRAAHLLLGTRDKDGTEMADEKKRAQRKLADDLLKRARAGEEFGKLAKDYSEDTGSRDRGGEINLTRGQSVPPEFEAAAFSLETNQVSDVVTTQFGYHLIKLHEKIPAKKFQLAEVASDVKLGLKRQGVMKQIPAYIEGIKKAAGVEILDQDIKKVIADQRAAEAEMEKLSDAKQADAPKLDEKKPDGKK